MVHLVKFLSKIVSFISRNLGLGTGVTWSGEIALLLDPHILSKLIPEKAKVVLIAGTNGKTTTAKMTEHVAKDKYQVVLNDTGANLINGLVGSILTQKPGNLYIFEVDESNLPIILDYLTPNTIVLLNLFRDQLDRYGEVDKIVRIWSKALTSPKLKSTTLVVNGNDPALVYLGESAKDFVKKVDYFGLTSKKLLLESKEHAVDSTFCPRCGTKLKFSGTYLSHLGLFFCPKCKFKNPEILEDSITVKTNLDGTYMFLNLLASKLTCRSLEIPGSEFDSLIESFKPAFGRQEIIELGGKKAKILLSKNPAGFNASLRTALEKNSTDSLFLALNDRIPDGTDVSWIWDVDFEMLNGTKRKIFVWGDRQFDLGLRLKYAEIPFEFLEPLDALKKSDGTLWVLPTYSAMLEIRKILTGKKIK